MEEVTLLRRLAEGMEHAAMPLIAADKREEAQRLQVQTEQVCEWLRSMAELVQPDPGK